MKANAVLGEVLAARSGLWTKQQALDALAETAAFYEHRGGPPLARPAGHHQRRDHQSTPPHVLARLAAFEDYYDEGRLIWLEADTLIRDRSQGKRSLDDFARSFFGIDDGSSVTVTYTFEDVVKALNTVEPSTIGPGSCASASMGSRDRRPLEGLRRGGYKLVYTDTPSELEKASDLERKRLSLRYSIGVALDDKDGMVLQVAWDSPAFKAKLTESAQILAVNGVAYSSEVLKDAIRSAKGTTMPIELIVKNGDRYRVVALDYHDGLRHPHLERDASVPARLDETSGPKKNNSGCGRLIAGSARRSQSRGSPGDSLLWLSSAPAKIPTAPAMPMTFQTLSCK